MTNATADVDRDQVSFTSLVPFLLIAFRLAWGIFVLFVFFPEEIVEISGELTGGHPLFFLAVYAPAVASLIIVAYYGGAAA